MDTGLILSLLVFFGLIISVPILFIMEVRSDHRKTVVQVEKDNASLAEEMQKPMSIIVFTTLDDVVHHTSAYNPYFTLPGSRWALLTTSKSAANKGLTLSYERGYFMDESCNTFPTCNIKSAKVV